MSRNSYFQFKQFRIVQERSAMKVGMDGVLLGAWANASEAKCILDIGTGTGLIALMLAQKNALADIDAIEIDRDACEEALFNVQQSDRSGRINLHCQSFQEFAAETENKYDLIVSNPPFFSNGVKAPAETRAQARHADALPLDVLISGAANLLQENARIALILPTEQLQEVKNLGQINGLSLSRLCRVRPNPVKPVFRILVELAKEQVVCQEENLMIEFEKHHDYTPEYRELTKDFYLKF
ncbi:MAG: methyltransferase [Prolixibacteraceae bacterium]|nr:methyltransferase [Prolixibacteraceae bacterium]